MIREELLPYICERFVKDEKYRTGHIRIINPLPDTEILGLHIPEMKKIAAKLASSGTSANLLNRFENSPVRKLAYEERMVWGFMLNKMKMPLEERLEHFSRFIPIIDNWAICDSICCNAGWIKGNDGIAPNGRVWQFLQPFFTSDREFEVRFALVLSMARMMTEINLPYIFEMIEQVDYKRIKSDYVQGKNKKSLCYNPDNSSSHKNNNRIHNEGPAIATGIAPGQPPYYVRMAVAWLLATALAKFPEAVRSFLAISSIPSDIRKLYARKARESFRTRNVAAF